jgi:hypothetical protein
MRQYKFPGALVKGKSLPLSRYPVANTGIRRVLSEEARAYDPLSLKSFLVVFYLIWDVDLESDPQEWRYKKRIPSFRWLGNEGVGETA